MVYSTAWQINQMSLGLCLDLTKGGKTDNYTWYKLILESTLSLEKPET